MRRRTKAIIAAGVLILTVGFVTLLVNAEKIRDSIRNENVKTRLEENSSTDPVTAPMDVLKSEEYEILVNDDRFANVKNFHVLMKKKHFDTAYVFSFMRKFRAEYCIGKCNVSIYDSPIVKDLVLKYPIKGKEYVTLADHYVSSTEFPFPDEPDWYPYQDIFYKEQGGKNWKKKPIH